MIFSGVDGVGRRINRVLYYRTLIITPTQTSQPVLPLHQCDDEHGK